MRLPLILTAILTISMTIVLLLPSLDSKVYAITNVNNTYFSINIPDNWTYAETTESKAAKILGFGPINSIELTPNKFGEFFLNQTKPLSEKMEKEGAYSSFQQKADYPIKNSPLDLFVKYEIFKHDELKVVTRENATIDNEPAVKIFSDGIKSSNGINFVEYFVMHNKEPYYLSYAANVKDFQKYLPQFEQMVKTFKFIK
jgi:PsbP-like protein